MAKELTGLGKFCKWVVLPVALAFVGYRFVGPNVGGIGARVPLVREVGQQISEKVKGKPAPPPPAPKPGATETAPQEIAPPADDEVREGANEFQRLRERENARTGGSAAGSAGGSTPRPRRRAPIDRID